MAVMDLNSLTALGDASGRRSLRGILEMLAKTPGIEADFLPFDCGGRGILWGGLLRRGRGGWRRFGWGFLRRFMGMSRRGRLGW